jgi:hypothetical protein
MAKISVILLFVFNFPPIKAQRLFCCDLLDLLQVNLSACLVKGANYTSGEDVILLG